ncbi:MAG: UDP-N-acetylmuramoyl-L-alanine--D-glutamate ligase [Patescibacteria group bacterium]
MNYKNKKVVIMGLGRIATGAGFSSAVFMARQKAKVIVTDLNKPSRLNKESIQKLKKCPNIKLVLGRHQEKDIINADLIIRNPAVKPNSPYLLLAKKHKVKITTDLEIFFEEIKNKKITIIGITGTRGKSTTTSLVYNILKAKYKNRVFLGGNIGNSPLNFVNKLKDNDIVVMEVASFQLNDIKNYHFNIAAITNILPDHLDYYASMSAYQKDKEKIFATQNQQDYIILNRLDPKLNKINPQKIKSQIIYSAKNKQIKLANIKLIGEHNLFNIDVAWQIAKLMKVPDSETKEVITNFSGVKDRLQLIRSLNGVKYYNDTTATHPKATVVALQSFLKNNIILISGGNSKNLPLGEMVREIKKRVKHLILVPGNANFLLPVGVNVPNIQTAVKKAVSLAKKGDVVLFSPGLTWLPRINEFKRGEIFTELVKKL